MVRQEEWPRPRLTVHALLLSFIIRHDVFVVSVVSPSVFLVKLIHAGRYRRGRERFFIISGVGVAESRFDGINDLGSLNS